MLRRLLVGLVVGAVVGVAAAAALVSGLQMLAFAGSFGALVAYGASAATGAVTGLVAGKPIWASDAKVEAGLKAFFGALLAAAGMFALRQWAAGWTLDLTAIHAGGPGPVGSLPAASLPLLGAALGGLFELDNSGDDEPSQRKRAPSAASAAKARVPVPGSEDEDEVSAASRRAGR
jgi:hypothetical protein